MYFNSNFDNMRTISRQSITYSVTHRVAEVIDEQASRSEDIVIKHEKAKTKAHFVAAEHLNRPTSAKAKPLDGNIIQTEANSHKKKTAYEHLFNTGNIEFFDLKKLHELSNGTLSDSSAQSIDNIMQSLLQMKIFESNNATLSPDIAKVENVSKIEPTQDELLLENISAAIRVGEAESTLDTSENNVVPDEHEHFGHFVSEEEVSFNEMSSSEDQNIVDDNKEKVSTPSETIMETVHMPTNMKWYYDNMPKDVQSDQDEDLEVEISDEDLEQKVPSLNAFLSEEVISDPKDSKPDTDIKPVELKPKPVDQELNLMTSCPSNCMCVCPTMVHSPSLANRPQQMMRPSATVIQSTIPNQTNTMHMGDGHRNKPNLFPCARSAVYQLNLALKICGSRQK